MRARSSNIPDLITEKYSSAFSNRLLALHYVSGDDTAGLFDQHKKWGLKFGQASQGRSRRFSNLRQEDKQIRIGYVSADFRTHSVSYFFEPIIAGHDKTSFETYCYSDCSIASHDTQTKKIRKYTDNWREIGHLNDDAVEKLIIQDEIDILVDLMGHTSGSRLRLFAKKPAPLQVTYLGYPNTTGLPTMDYRITDQFADPPGQTELFHSEELLRLDNGFLCYQPIADAPEINALPASQAGHVTFGSFNNLAKIHYRWGQNADVVIRMPTGAGPFSGARAGLPDRTHAENPRDPSHGGHGLHQSQLRAH